MAGGAIVGAIGIPLWLIGARITPLPKDDKAPKAALVPELRISAGAASLSFGF